MSRDKPSQRLTRKGCFPLMQVAMCWLQFCSSSHQSQVCSQEQMLCSHGREGEKELGSGHHVRLCWTTEVPPCALCSHLIDQSKSHDQALQPLCSHFIG